MEPSEKDNIHVFRIDRERPLRERSTTAIAKGSKSRTSISGGTKRLICEDHMRNPRCTQEELATKYGCKRTTIAKIIKGKERWLLIDSDVTAKRFRQRNSRYPVIEDALFLWIQKEQQENNTMITDQMLQSQARLYAQTCEKDAVGFKASGSWLLKFKQRYMNEESIVTKTENDSEERSASPPTPTTITTAAENMTDTINAIPATTTTTSVVENTTTTATSIPSPNHVYHDTQRLVLTSREEKETPPETINHTNDRNNMIKWRYSTFDNGKNGNSNSDIHELNEQLPHTPSPQLPTSASSSIIESPVPEITTTTTHLLEQQQETKDEEMDEIGGGFSPWQSDDDDKDYTRIEKDKARQHLEAVLSYYTSQQQESSMSAELIRLILQKDF